MSKPKVIYHRPDYWRLCSSDILHLIHVPIEGDKPTLRSGLEVGDGVGGVVNEDGKRKLIEAFEEHQPDYFFYWALHGDFTPTLCRYLAEVSPRTKFIFGQGNQVLHKGLVDRWIVNEGFGAFTKILLTNHYNRERYDILREWGVQKIGVLYDGFDPRMFEVPTTPPIYDCFFGGGNTCKNYKHKGKFPNSEFRRDLMKALSDNYDVLIRGGNWLDMPFKEGVTGQRYVEEMQSAKFIIGCYHYDFERYYTKRTIYALASTRPYLTKYIPDMEKDFINHQNVIWVDSPQEAVEWVKYYKSNPTKREQIGLEARDLAIEKHSWKARLREFENFILEL